ncbi:MAG: S24 family peptidase [Burkholderiaceae bacterium]|nr:S24 family peptidase [Burkholderiaceae bacterium]
MSEKVKNVIAEQQMTQEEFAGSIGMSYERLRNVCQGRVLKLKKEEADAIARVYGINQQWLVNDLGRKMLSKAELRLQKGLDILRSASEAGLISRSEPAEQQIVQERIYKKATGYVDHKPANVMLDYVFIPKYEITASAGNGSIIHDESVVDHLAFKRSWVMESLGLDPKHLALIDVGGDSMSPTIDNGDLILLDTRKGRPKSEGVYVINLHGALLVKRIRMKLNGVIEVCSDNPRYQTETVTSEEAGRLTMVGRVVWHGRKF